jgi:predicted RNA binding protein YcfA (HicA-like mRNA interferase family)
MAKKQDDITKLLSNKKSTRFDDLVRIMKQHGWELRSTKGSHHTYTKAGFLPIMIVKPHANKKYCHPMDVNKVINALELEAQREGQR